MRPKHTWLVNAALAVALCALPAVVFAARDTSTKSSSTTSAAKTPAKRPAAGKHPLSKGKKKVIARKHVPPAQLAPTSARISEIQTALAKAGPYQGEPDGQWDSQTIDAYKRFQSSHGLTPTGKLDALTLQKLGLGSEVAGRGAPAASQTPSRLSAAPSSAEAAPAPAQP